MHKLGERIRKRRQELGWTQEELSRKSGISKGFLSDVENGKRSVSAENLSEIAQVLGLSLDFLMKGEDPPGQAHVVKPVEIPAALSDFANEEGLSYRQTLTLLQMRRQILAHRGLASRVGRDDFDWRKLYESVKEFLNE